MISIRQETPDDYDAVRELTASAFAASEFGHNGEAELVVSLRSDSPKRLSLVATLGSEIVGHVLFTPAIIRSHEENMSGMGLAPMSVAPHHQRNGVGTLLVTSGLNLLFQDECRFVVVLGHPAFYSRFGFEPAAQFGVKHGFSGIPQEVFLIRFAPDHGEIEFKDGRAFYQPAFGAQHEDNAAE